MRAPLRKCLGLVLYCTVSISAQQPGQSTPKRLFEEIGELHSTLQIAQVRLKLAELAEKHPQVKREKAYTSLLAELEVIGKDAKFEVIKWIQGRVVLDHSGLTMLVFWESWCPHCQDDMPAVQKQYERFLEEGLSVVGLTRMTMKAKLTSVISFIAERELHFPIARVAQTMADYYDVRGVPASVLIKNSKVVWRGKPINLTEETIRKALAL